MLPDMRYRLVLFLALFWFAQVKGVVHEISHLAAASQTHQSISNSDNALCAECLALAQAGAAPLHTAVALNLPTAVHVLPISGASLEVSDRTFVAYRSRAPPSSSI